MGNKQTTLPPTPTALPSHYSISLPTGPPNVPQPLYENINPQPQTSQPAARVGSMQGLPGEAPGSMFCPYCQTTVVTTVRRVHGSMQWLLCLLFSALGLWLFAWIPFFIDAWRDVEHSCYNCGRVIHVYRQMRSEGQ